jgi:hypothetical protein
MVITFIVGKAGGYNQLRLFSAVQIVTQTVPIKPDAALLFCMSMRLISA